MKEEEEYFSRNKNGEAILVSNGTEYHVTFAVIDGVDYFYQYPTEEEMLKGAKITRRQASEVNNWGKE